MRFAFSLVELSVVLVIIGLIAGGVLAGQSLIRAAELRSVTTELDQYQKAIKMFRDQYSAIPGDIADAASFWGYPGGNAVNCPATAGTGTETCNGNGNGWINNGNASEFAEPYMFWQHLVNAGFIVGDYSGMTGSASTTHSDIGVNVPTSKISTVGWHANSWTVNVGNGVRFAIKTSSWLAVGQSTTTSWTGGAFLTPEEAWSIDKKTDDGLAARGKTIARHWDDCTDAADENDLDAEYVLSTTTQECALYFLQAF